MKLLITKYKSTGKWYINETIQITKEESFDVRQTVINKYRGYDGYITIFEIHEDGFEQPIRLVTKEELSTFEDVMEKMISSQQSQSIPITKRWPRY